MLLFFIFHIISDFNNFPIFARLFANTLMLKVALKIHLSLISFRDEMEIEITI